MQSLSNYLARTRILLTWSGYFIVVFILFITFVIYRKKKRGEPVKKVLVLSGAVIFTWLVFVSYVSQNLVGVIYNIQNNL